MSTYNGEKYLEDQINSIIDQSYSNWHLYIRDDGSTDNTVSIIKHYTNIDSRITFFNPDKIQNVGVTSSFMNLLNNIEADYYMFSDQDDYWKKNKIEICMEKAEQSAGPICVFTELQVVDKDLNEIELMNKGEIWSDFPHFLFGNCVTGCTMLINNKLKSIIKINKTNFNNIYLHDWWIALICSAFGKLIYIDKPTILYRQHGDNTEGSKKDNIASIIHRSLNLDNEEIGMIKIIKMDLEFFKIWGNSLSGINRKYLDSYNSLFSYPPYNFVHRCKLVKNFPPLRKHFRGRLLFSFLVLCRYNSMLKMVNEERTKIIEREH